MASSLDLQREFQALCKNVYFHPPESVKLSYPCIIYKRSAGDTRFADNKKYSYTAGYDVVVVEMDPDRKLATDVYTHFVYCREGSPYISNNLYHSPFTIYF